MTAVYQRTNKKEEAMSSNIPKSAVPRRLTAHFEALRISIPAELNLGKERERTYMDDSPSWRTANEIISHTNIPPAKPPRRNVVATLACDGAWAMPWGIDISIRCKGESRMALKMPKNREVSTMVWKYSNEAQIIMYHFLRAFPMLTAAIQDGIQVPRERSQPFTNTNQYIYGLSEELAVKVSEWIHDVVGHEPRRLPEKTMDTTRAMLAKTGGPTPIEPPTEVVDDGDDGILDGVAPHYEVAGLALSPITSPKSPSAPIVVPSPAAAAEAEPDNDPYDDTLSEASHVTAASAASAAASVRSNVSDAAVLQQQQQAILQMMMQQGSPASWPGVPQMNFTEAQWMMLYQLYVQQYMQNGGFLVPPTAYSFLQPGAAPAAPAHPSYPLMPGYGMQNQYTPHANAGRPEAARAPMRPAAGIPQQMPRHVPPAAVDPRMGYQHPRSPTMAHGGSYMGPAGFGAALPQGLVVRGESKAQKKKKLRRVRMEELDDGIRHNVAVQHCRQVLNEDVDTSVTQLLQHLARLKTDRTGVKKKYVAIGLREVLKQAKKNALGCVIMASNIEGGTADGLAGTVDHIVERCNQFGTLVVFALSRMGISHALGKTGHISCVGLLLLDEAREQFARVRAATVAAQAAWENGEGRDQFDRLNIEPEEADAASGEMSPPAPKAGAIPMRHVPTISPGTPADAHSARD